MLWLLLWFVEFDVVEAWQKILPGSKCWYRKPWANTLLYWKNPDKFSLIAQVFHRASSQCSLTAPVQALGSAWLCCSFSLFLKKSVIEIITPSVSIAAQHPCRVWQTQVLACCRAGTYLGAPAQPGQPAPAWDQAGRAGSLCPGALPGRLQGDCLPGKEALEFNGASVFWWESLSLISKLHFRMRQAKRLRYLVSLAPV